MLYSIAYPSPDRAFASAALQGKRMQISEAIALKTLIKP